jgi:hypothetical protein
MPPETCGPSIVPGCPTGHLCVQHLPPYCSTDYLGRCQPVPTDCPPGNGPSVCPCDGFPEYPSECEARKAGYKGLLSPCPHECCCGDCGGHHFCVPISANQTDCCAPGGSRPATLPWHCVQSGKCPDGYSSANCVNQ